MWLTHPEKSCRSQSTNQSGEWNKRLTDLQLCFSIFRFSQVVLFPRAQPHAQPLFSISNGFGIIFVMGARLPPPPPPPPPPAPLKPNIGPRSCEAASPTKITSSLDCLAQSRDALRAAASIARYHCCSCAFFGYTTKVLAVNVDQRPVLLPYSRFRHNALLLSSFSCSLIAVELHCDAWCSHEVHWTLQPRCGYVRVRCCRIFVIALPWVRSKFEQLQCRPGTAKTTIYVLQRLSQT